MPDYNVTIVSSGPAPSTCVAEGSLITMADGTQKAVEDVQVGDMVMTWNFFTGGFEAQPVIINDTHDGTATVDIFNLTFSDGSVSRVIGRQGFFNVEENKFIYIDSSTYDQYIGSNFVKYAVGGSREYVTLDKCEITTETVGIYSIVTAYNANFITDNVLSLTDDLHTGVFEYFEVGEDMKYDEAKMQADIEKYGLYDYEDVSEFFDPVAFELLNAKYFKVSVGKGNLTYEKLREIITEFVK